MKIVAFIFARGGSKGVPKKNIRHIAGKPLIAHAIATAQESKHITKVVVSTDNPDIGNIAERYGAEVLIRPGDLASDTSLEFASWKHAVDHYNMHIFVNVPATCPLRTVEDIDKTIEAYKYNAVDVAFTTKEVKEFILDMDGIPAARRQDLPKRSAVVGSCYVTNPQFIRRSNSIFDGSYMTVEVPEERSLDIDTEFDFTMAKLFMEQA